MAAAPNSGAGSAGRHIFILAGEPSGDHIGADLMRTLKLRAPVSFYGVGGPEMLAQGLDSYFDMSELMVMGFADVIKQLPRLLGWVRTTADHIIETKPDAVVLVDYQEFSTLLAKRLRGRGYSGPIILCVAPSVWAWRPGRAKKLHGVFDEILAVLPFEPKVMAALGGPRTTYIGHPAAGALPVVTPPQKGLLMLLPGSRRGEVRRHMQVFRQVAEGLAEHPSVAGIVLPTLPRLEGQIRAQLADWSIDVEVVVGREFQEELYSRTVVALASSGTVTLELALRGVPFVGTYVPDFIQAVSYLFAGRPRILLPNVIANDQIVPEELFGATMVRRITAALTALIEVPEIRSAQIAQFDAVRQMMEQGMNDAKKQDAVDRILHYLA